MNIFKRRDQLSIAAGLLAQCGHDWNPERRKSPKYSKAGKQLAAARWSSWAKGYRRQVAQWEQKTGWRWAPGDGLETGVLFGDRGDIK